VVCCSLCFWFSCGLGFVGWGVGVGRRESMRESTGVRFGLMGGGEKVELCLCFCMMCDAWHWLCLLRV